jgi:hypothetical protein
MQGAYAAFESFGILKPLQRWIIAQAENESVLVRIPSNSITGPLDIKSYDRLALTVV